jgi:hypothetical protein
MQSGTIRKRNNQYFLRIYVGETQREFALGSTHDLPTKADQECAADNYRLRLGVARTGAKVTLEDFAEHRYLRMVDTRLRQSTAKDYRRRFNKYIKGRKEARMELWQYRTVRRSEPAERNRSRSPATGQGIPQENQGAAERHLPPLRCRRVPGRQSSARRAAARSRGYRPR